MNILLPDLQKKVYKKLQEALISGLDRGELTTDDMQKVSYFIVRNMDVVESTDELMLVLRDIGEKWSPFKQVYIQFKQEEASTYDNQRLINVQEKLRQLTQSQ
ncbi:MAG: hypothetical protein WC489_07045 [Patescibacteria group bacterium]